MVEKDFLDVSSSYIINRFGLLLLVARLASARNVHPVQSWRLRVGPSRANLGPLGTRTRRTCIRYLDAASTVAASRFQVLGVVLTLAFDVLRETAALSTMALRVGALFSFNEELLHIISRGACGVTETLARDGQWYSGPGARTRS